VECQGCRLIRLSPWPRARELGRHYPRGFWGTTEAHSKIEEYYRHFRVRDQVHFVQKGLRKAGLGGPVLEIAARGGWFLEQLAQRGHPVVSLEFDIAAADAAWRAKHVPSICGTLPQAPFAPNTFAGIALFQVLEHLYDPVGHLEAAHTLLQPNGRLFVQVPNAACWQFLLLGERWAGLDAPRHLIHYRARDLEILLDRCGFAVERVKYFSLAENPSMFASSLVHGIVPETRRLSGRRESQGEHVAKDLAYQALTVAAIPFVLVEAACRAGSTVLFEARARK
jgi:SAM-dependent methyltransferase